MTRASVEQALSLDASQWKEKERRTHHQLLSISFQDKKTKVQKTKFKVQRGRHGKEVKGKLTALI